MEDVIFAGTSGRAPLGRAEVSLTIDNTDGALPIEYAEVTISRILFRNGQSEYQINGEASRLLDIQELLSDSGIGREMPLALALGLDFLLLLLLLIVLMCTAANANLNKSNFVLLIML